MPHGATRFSEDDAALWVNGQSRIVVIAGIDTAAGKVKVYDPATCRSDELSSRGLPST